MTPAGILRALADADVAIVRDPAGRPALDDPLHHVDEELLAAVRRHRWIVTWALEGQRTGYAWMACDQCDQLALLSVNQGGKRRCRITFECEGSHLKP